jgi:hypothetical protein
MSPSDKPDAGPERRRDPRLEQATQVAFELRFVDDQGGSITLNSQTLDISKSGIRLALDHELPVGFITELCIDNLKGQMMLLFAEVKWCRATCDGFQIGMELLDAEKSDLAYWQSQLAAEQ